MEHNATKECIKFWNDYFEKHKEEILKGEIESIKMMEQSHKHPRILKFHIPTKTQK